MKKNFDIDDDWYEDAFEEIGPSHKKKKKRSGKGRKSSPFRKLSGVFGALAELSTGERIVVSTGIIVLILAIVTGSVFVSARSLDKQMDGFADLGKSMEQLSVSGESGLIAVTDAHVAALNSAIIPQEGESELLEEESEGEPDDRIIMNLTSVQKDLKVKFLNGGTGKLFEGIAFKAQVEDPSGKTETWEDDNKDGIIYKTGIKAGEYLVTIMETDDIRNMVYSLETLKVTVKDKIEYKKVDVRDEVKNESQVNVAKEDTAIQEAEVAPANKDTVDWVESAKTGGQGDSADYTEINKSNIPDPSAESAGRRTFAALSNFVDVETDSANELNTVWIDNEGQVQEEWPQEDDDQDDQDDQDDGDDSDGEVVIDLTGDDQFNDQENALQDDIVLQNPPTSITISGPTQIAIGDTVSFTAKVEGKNLSTSDKKIIWFIDDSYARVDSQGRVTGKSKGTCKINAVSEYYPSIKSATITIEVKDKSEITTTEGAQPENSSRIQFTPGSVNLALGESKTVLASVVDVKAPVYIYSVDHPEVVSINPKNLEVTVKALKEGTARVELSVTEAGQKFSAGFKVTVGKSPQEDKATKLKDKDGRQVYIKNSEGKYVEAVLADYYSAKAFFVKNGSEGEPSYRGWQEIDGVTYYFDKNGKKVTGSQVIQGAKYEFADDGALKGDSKAAVMGIDVSKWNGTINWNSVKAAGVKYAIIRCGYRGSATGVLVKDPKFRENLVGAQNAGIKVGVYFFSQAINEIEAVEEASMVLDTLSGAGLTYPVFLDVEPGGGRADGIDKATRTAAVNAFCKTIQNSGYKAGVYANKTWFETKLSTSSLTGYKLWLAQYTAAPTYTATRYDMWQYTSKGSISGISGNVDLNLSYLGL